MNRARYVVSTTEHLTRRFHTRRCWKTAAETGCSGTQNCRTSGSRDRKGPAVRPPGACEHARDTGHRCPSKEGRPGAGKRLAGCTGAGCLECFAPAPASKKLFIQSVGPVIDEPDQSRPSNGTIYRAIDTNMRRTELPGRQGRQNLAVLRPDGRENRPSGALMTWHVPHNRRRAT